jgi:hypothetical protein
MSLDERLRSDLAALRVDPPAPGPTLDRVRARGQRRRRRRVIVPVAAALVAILVLVTGAIAGARRSSTLHVVGPPSTVARPSPSTTGAPSTVTTPPPPASSSTAPQRPTTTLAVPTTVGTTECPTDLGIGDAAGFGSIGLTNVTPRAPIAGLGPITAYRDTHRFTELLGPPGWTCHALDAADGSIGLNLYAPGSAPGSSGGLPWLGGPGANITNGITSQIVPACVGCIQAMVCGVFPAAPAALNADIPCTNSPGAGETDITLDPSVVSFSVPAGVKGTWDNTDGTAPADGVVMFMNRGSHYEAYMAVCVLPSSQHAVCTAVLDDFVTRLR